jgi:glyoxylase-like metal-dependent hydrolase (beta-lactamase superfamily II)
MRRLDALTVLLASVLAAACGSSGSLQGAADELGTTEINSIEYAGSGRWFQFGQAASPKTAWPQFDVSSFTATIDYKTPAARVQMTRLQTVTPTRLRPTPVEQRPDQYVSGTTAWNMAAPGGSPPGTPPAPQAQPAAVEERLMEIWSTPHGFIKAAMANNATSTQIEDQDTTEVSFKAGGLTYKGTINGEDQLVRVQTAIDNPVLGDATVDIAYSDYKDFDGIQFPSRIVRTQGGHPVLEITVTSVKANPPVEIAAPDVTAPPVTATAEKLGDGVYYIKGGTHHSVAIDQGAHIVVVEAPLNEARSLAVIAKVKETIPNKPILFVVNTHHHFDHSGGLRTYVDEGATVVTHFLNQPYYETAWAAPRTLNPDKLAQSKKAAKFATFTDKHILTGRRPIEVHVIARNGHNDAFAMIYLPRERILIEGDAYTPPAAGTPPPDKPNPFWVNLEENIQRLKLDVRQIAPLHGQRLVTMADLRADIGKPAGATN